MVITEISISPNIANNLYNLLFRCVSFMMRVIYKQIKYEPVHGKTTICIGENKGADQLRGNREADQRLCFRYSDSTIPLLLKSEISSF